MGGDDDDGDAMASHHGKGSGGASGGGAVGLAWKKAEVRRTRRQMELSRYVAPGKENVPVFCSNVGEPLQRSPLPVGYPRLPLQDITAAILSPLNQLREEEDESGGHKRPKQRKAPKKKLSRPCPPVIEDLTETTSKGQSSQQATVTVTESSSEARTSERPPVPAAPEELLSGISGIEEQGTVVLKPINQESNTEVQLLVAESSHLLKKKTTVVATTTTPPGLGRGAAASCSPSGSHKTKRRKPLPKPTPGRNVARFR
jgi:hypothetical protein